MNIEAVIWEPSIGIDLFFFTFRWYSLMFILAYTFGYVLMKRMFINDNVELKHLETLLTYLIVSMFVGMRLGDVFFYSWDYYQNNLLEIVIPFRKIEGETAFWGLLKDWKFTGFTGLASHGAAIAIIFSMFLFSAKELKRSTFFILDRLAVVVPLGGFFVRIGNFFNSEIYGKETESNFGVIFKAAGETVARHPTQLYEAFSYLLLFFVLSKVYWKTDKREKEGYIFGIFMIALWALRLSIEFLKEPQVGARADWILNTGQLLSIPCILVGIWLVIRDKVQVRSDALGK